MRPAERPVPELHVRAVAILAAVSLVVGFLLAASVPREVLGASGTYRNPLEPVVAGDGIVESCADPTVIWGQENEGRWYMYCTTDPLNDDDRDAGGGFNFRLIPMFSSADLVNWTYEGDAFAARPGWVADDAGLWAPEISYANGQYYLYYAASWTDLPGGGSAIGVATSDGPLGPWTDSGTPAVEPHAPGCCPNDKRWTFDPDVITAADGTRYIYYGSYFGGLSVRELSADGLTSDPATQVEIAIANRYEGAEVIQRDGWYYLLASATDCCRGPLTGYSVFVGRSESPTGPFVDREGASFLAGRVGGTPFLTMNGNRWVGTGHQTTLEDFAGQWWTIYHAVDVTDPYFEGAVGFTKRPALLDAVDWVDGWPIVNGGAFASDGPRPVPAAQPGDTTKHRYRPVLADRVGPTIGALSDDFSGTSLGGQWSWVREPDGATWSIAGGVLRWETQAADLFEGSNNASVLVQDTPDGNYVVETKVRLDLPAEGCCFNYVQAGLVIYGDDDNFIKLVHVSIWETRQTEFAKELAPVPAGYPRYGNTVVGPPGEWTWLRIVKRSSDRAVGGPDTYTAYTSRDGETWVRGGTWTHDLGEGARIGLVSMGGSGFAAEFDYVRLSRVSR